MSAAPKRDEVPRLLAPPQRPHIYTGSPRDPYCARCHSPISQVGRECRGSS